jgi:hypothetical protein
MGRTIYKHLKTRSRRKHAENLIATLGESEAYFMLGAAMIGGRIKTVTFVSGFSDEFARAVAERTSSTVRALIDSVNEAHAHAQGTIQ